MSNAEVKIATLFVMNGLPLLAKIALDHIQAKTRIALLSKFERWGKTEEEVARSIINLQKSGSIGKLK